MSREELITQIQRFDRYTRKMDRMTFLVVLGAFGIFGVALTIADAHGLREHPHRFWIAVIPLIPLCVLTALPTWIRERHRRRDTPKCPVCEAALVQMLGRITVASGRCPMCGAIVINE